MGYDKNTGYYSFRELFGYGAKWNILLSPERGVGKTYGYKHWIVESEDLFVIVYRTGPDMEHAVSNWLDDLTIKGPKGQRLDRDRFGWEGDKEGGYQLRMDGEVKCYFRSMTAVNAIKQETFPDEVAWMIVDEFIPLAYKKLPGIFSEGEALEQIARTIDHDTVHTRRSRGLKPLRCLLIGNPFTLDNPILSYFGVNGLIGYGIFRSEKWRRMHPDDPEESCVWEYLEPRSKGGSNDVTKRNAAANAGTGAFIELPPRDSVPELSVRLSDKIFQLRRLGITGLYWIVETPNHQGVGARRKYGTLDGLRPDEICTEGVDIIDRLRNSAFRGLLRYADVNVKYDFLSRLM